VPWAVQVVALLEVALLEVVALLEAAALFGAALLEVALFGRRVMRMMPKEKTCHK
jgi:hypothetical protein